MRLKKMALVSILGLLAITGCKNDSSSSDPVTSGSPVDPWANHDWDFPGWDVESDIGGAGEELDGHANGVRNFANNPLEDREEILHLLEKYTLENFLGGIPYRDNSGYVLYHDRLEIPADDYVVGYGFGVGEALIDPDRPLVGSEITPKHALYYHTWQSQDPGTINYMNAQDSVTSDLYAMVSASYWSTRFNDDKTGYEWYPLLADAAADRPIMLNEDKHGMATKFRVPVQVGGDLKYNTLSDDAAIKAFDGRVVAIEDYLTPFKLMLDNDWFRATDLASRGSGFKGVAAYRAQKGEKDWSNVGIQIGDDNASLEFEFLTPKTPFKAMYSLSSSLFSPIPMEFVDAIGGADEFGKPNIDSTLSLGVYTLEEWETDKQVVFKKNPNYIEKEKYTHEGYVYTILKDNNIAFQEFLVGNLDSAGVPSIHLKNFKSDDRARQTKGDTVWKLQVNAADEELWDELFGENGSVSPGAEWDLKPVMSNEKFLQGLYSSLDREKLADETGSRPAQAFLSDAYMVDAEGGVAWRDTEQGKAVVEGLAPETHGYSQALAATFFNDAMDELVAANKYERGTNADPTLIELQLIFQTASQVATEGKELTGMIERAFNGEEGSPVVEGFQLKVNAYATEDWMDAYYAAMEGEFDLAFGSISGNTLDPIDFMETVMSDNRSGFTLSWGVDTSLPSEDLVFEGEIYSFNALQQSALGLTVVQNGREATLLSFDKLAWDIDRDSQTLAISASGSYYDDDEYVIDPDDGDEPLNVNEFPFMGIAIFTRPGALAGVIGLEATTWADGKWTVEAEGLPLLIDDGAFWLDFYLNTVHTYDGIVESKTNVVETMWPTYEAQL